MARWSPTLLLLYTLHLLTTTLGVAAQYPSRPRAPGVAFRLTPDYGIAAIYFQDGTSVPVARIQGSPKYQALMRKSTASETTGQSTLCRLLPQALDSLPSAFNVDICRHDDVSITKTLLASLRAAVESYLGTNICFAALILDDIEGHAANAEEALRALGLRQVLWTIRTGKSAVLAHTPSTLPTYDVEPWFVLAVDYSSRWFNIGLYTIDDVGIVDPVDDAVRGLKIGEKDQSQAFKEALEHLIANPPPDLKLPQQIHHLVLYGDDAMNKDAQTILAGILDVSLVQGAYVSSSVFDDVIEIARSAHRYMDSVDFETSVPAAFGCRWRSRLHQEDHNEL